MKFVPVDTFETKTKIKRRDWFGRKISPKWLEKFTVIWNMSSKTIIYIELTDNVTPVTFAGVGYLLCNKHLGLIKQKSKQVT